jgi:hypothetical protein
VTKRKRIGMLHRHSLVFLQCITRDARCLALDHDNDFVLRFDGAGIGIAVDVCICATTRR